MASVPGNYSKTKRKFNRKRLLIAQAIAVALLLIIIILAAYLMLKKPVAPASANDNPAGSVDIPDDGKLFDGIVVGTVDVSGKTVSEAKALVSSDIENKLRSSEIEIKSGDDSWKLYAADLSIAGDTDKALQEAYLLGRSGSVVENMTVRNQIKSEGQTVAVSYTFSEDALREKLEAISAEVGLAPVEPTFKYNPETEGMFDYVAGTDGTALDVDKLFQEISAKIVSGDFTPVNAEIVVKAPADTIDSLKAKTGLIVSFTTEYKKGSEAATNRVKNIAKGAGKINGAVLEPGEVWSFNKHVGPRNEEGGWFLAPGITNGNSYQMEYGGGICQVSTTLYGAAIRAELEIPTLKHHSWPSHYVPMGLDATVSSNGPDLEIKNNRTGPIYIVCVADTKEKILTVNIYGPKGEHDYTVDFRSVTVKETPPPEMQITEDPTMPVGYSKVTIQPHTGFQIEVYKQYLDASGQVVKDELFEEYRYAVKQGVKVVGTKKETINIPTE